MEFKSSVGMLLCNPSPCGAQLGDWTTSDDLNGEFITSGGMFIGISIFHILLLPENLPFW